MDLKQKRPGFELSWQIADEGINGSQQDSGGRREFHVPFENISVLPTLLCIAKPQKSLIAHALLGSLIILFLVLPLLVAVVAFLPLSEETKVPVTIILFFVAIIAWLSLFVRTRPGLRYISTAFNANAKPFFWFFLPDAQEKDRVAGFLDEVYKARNAFLREKCLPQVEAAKAPQEVHELVMTLLREKVMDEAEFEGFKTRFCPQKRKIGFSPFSS